MNAEGRRDIALVCVCGFTFFFGFGLFTLFPLYLAGFGLSPGQIGVMLSMLFVSSMTVRPLLGTVAGQIGSRRLALAASLLWIISVLGLLFMRENTLWLVYPLRLLQGAGLACMDLVVSIVPQRLLPARQRGRGFGFISIFFVLGWMGAPAVAEWILGWGSFTDIFLLSIFMALVAMIAGLGLRLPAQPRPAAGIRLSARGMWRGALNRELILLLLAGCLGMGLVTGSYSNFIPLYAESREVGAGAVFFLAASVSSVLVRTFLSGLSDRWGRWQVLGPVFLFGILAQLLLFDMRSALVLILAGLIFGAQSGMQMPITVILSAETQERPGDEGANNPSLAIGLFLTSFDLGAWAGASIFGFVAEAIGYGPAFLGLAAANLSAATLTRLGLRAARRRLHRASTETQGEALHPS